MNYYKNIEYKLELSIIDTRGNFVSGLNITYKIYKSLDNSLFDTGTMTEIGTSGIYNISVIFPESIQYRVEYYTPNKYENGIETINVEEISDIRELVTKVLGLCQSNYRIFSPHYITKKGQACMDSATIKTYPTAIDCENDTNKLAEYHIIATFDNNANMTGYKVKEV